LQTANRFLAVLVTYFLCWKFAAIFTVAADVSALYPAAGCLLFFFYRWDWRITAFAALAAMLVETWPQHTLLDWTEWNYLQLLRQFLVYGGAALLARRYRWLTLPLVTLDAVIRLLLVALSVSLVSAILALPIFWVYLPVLRESIPEIFLGFWVGDFSGVVVFLGLASVIASSRNPSDGKLLSLAAPTPAKKLAGLIVSSLAVVVLIGFIGAQGQLLAYSYLILLPVMFGAVAFGLNFGITAAALANFAAVITYHQLGLTQMPVLQFQLLCALVMCVGMTLGAAIDDQRVASFDAWHDPLTGMLNRRALFEQGQRMLERARRHQFPVAVIMLDLDHFKAVNDTYGHSVGDTMLRGVAEKFQSITRAGDLSARIGGEEFALLAEGVDAAQAVQIAERLRLLICQLKSGNSIDAASASLGVALSSAGEESLEQLLADADRALYAAKKGGRNRVMLASSDDPECQITAA
jgi:diguanylate cyclase (GGDEF)-like protein